jgi:hypothetical protein
MTPPVRAAVLSAFNAIPTTDSNFARRRAQAAIYLVATSPHYEVQR